jgi:hypothetical protein
MTAAFCCTAPMARRPPPSAGPPSAADPLRAIAKSPGKGRARWRGRSASSGSDVAHYPHTDLVVVEGS